MVAFDMNEGLIGSLPIPGQKKGNDPSGTPIQATQLNADNQLDVGIEQITRKTVAVKADNINNIFSENINVIAESVNTFQQMEEEQVQNDPALLYQKQKETYDQEIEKLAIRVQKQTNQSSALHTEVETVTQELAQIEYEKQ